MTIQGTPANGDEFTISPSTGTDQYQSIFATLDRQLTILETPVANSAKGAQQSTDLGNIIQQLDQALSNLGTLRSESGARLRVVEQSSQFRDDDKLDIQQSLSDLRDIDMAEALASPAVPCSITSKVF
jgi:flagellar hook-associated protein 3 FlgL